MQNNRKVLKTNLYQKLKYKFPRRTIEVPEKFHTFAVDLVDMNSEQLGKSGYILNVVDIATRYAQARKLSHKNEAEIQSALSDIFTVMGKPRKLWSDMESGITERLAKELGVEVYHVDNSYRGPDTHSVAIVERFNRTMKEAMMQYKTELGAKNWNQLIKHTIDNFIPEYNNKVHSTIKMTPNDALEKADNDQLKNMQDERASEVKKAPKDILTVGTKVYLQKKQEIIRGKKETKYHEQLYEITGIKETNPMTYTLSDWGETGFYRQQLIVANDQSEKVKEPKEEVQSLIAERVKRSALQDRKFEEKIKAHNKKNTELSI